MEQKELMNNQEQAQNLESMPTEKDVFDKVAQIIRENLVATFTKESDTSLIIRSVGGLEFRLTIQSV